MSARNSYQDLRNKLADIRREMKAAAKAAFEEGCNELFNDNPTLESFGWRQYTPYFNDGDECVFNAHIEEPDINSICGYDIIYGDNHSDLAPLQEVVTDFLSVFRSEDFKDLFGDHVQVNVNRKGVNVDYYNHD